MALMARRAQQAPVMSRERQAVADALAAAHAEAAERAAAEAALQPAVERIWAAERAVQAAEENLVAVRSQATSEAATALMTGQDGVSPTLREARSRLVDAGDALDIAKAARGQVEARLAKAREGWNTARLDQAITAVIATEGAERAKRLGQDLMRLQREMMATAAELRWLVDNGAVPRIEEHGFSFGRPIDAEVALALGRVKPGNFYPEWDALIPQAHPRQRWVDAVAALSRDANAPLPSAG